MTTILRHLCIFAVLIALGIGSRAAYTQAQPAATGPGSFIAVGGGVTAFQADYGQRVLGGSFAFVDVHPTWRYGLEGEARYLRFHTAEDVTQTTYLGGLHVYIRPHKFRPYVKFLAGMGRLDFPFHYARGTYFAMAPGAGVDYMISDRITIRAVDFEYQEWPQFTYGKLHPYGVSAGISFRINPIRRYPR
jgi:opacity protein-like surface antigen